MVATVVTREAEWDDSERSKMLALARYEAEIHDGCGLHDSVAKTDPNLALEADTCPVCASLAKAMRLMAAEDDKAAALLGKTPLPSADLPADGRRMYLRPADPTT